MEITVSDRQAGSGSRLYREVPAMKLTPTAVRSEVQPINHGSTRGSVHIRDGVHDRKPNAADNSRRCF